jgi:predicted short-subunit dehydrogenase-like oxidoreductase (DUF2520 family)
MKKSSISIIGAGNIAHSLLPAILNGGYNVDYIFSKSGKSAKKLAEKYGVKFGQELFSLESELIIICTNDTAIESVAQKLKSKEKQTIIHTSGSIPLTALSRFHNNSAVLYPLQTFSKERKIDITNIPICIEATNTETLNTIEELASRLSKNVVQLSSEKRLHLHMAAVFACNFTNLLYSVGSDILETKEMNFSLLHPLILETAKKATENIPAKVQTGPALRNDIKTIEKHKKALSGEQLEMYEMLTNWIKNRHRDKDNA